MELFQFDGEKVMFSPQALALRPFKALWDRDKTKDKKRSFAELALLYYVVDYRSPFNNYVDVEERFKAALELIDLNKGWKPDKKFDAAMELYKELQITPAIEALETARLALDKVKGFVNDLDMKEKDNRGAYIHSPANLIKYVKDIEGALESLEKVETRVKKQIENKNELKGEQVAADFEDGEI